MKEKDVCDYCEMSTNNHLPACPKHPSVIGSGTMNSWLAGEQAAAKNTSMNEAQLVTYTLAFQLGYQIGVKHRMRAQQLIASVAKEEVA